MRIDTKALVFKEMDMGIRWLIAFSLWLIHTEFRTQGLATALHTPHITKPIFLGAIFVYLGYLVLELANYLGIGGGSPPTGATKAIKFTKLTTNPNFSALVDLIFLTTAMVATPVMKPFLFPFYLYYALILSLRNPESKPLLIGFFCALFFFAAHFIPANTANLWVSLISSTLVFIFSAIVWEVSRAFDGFYQRNQHAMNEIEYKNTLLEKTAQTDFLTDLYNHQAFYEALDRYTKYKTPLSLILFDIDNFKKINDQYGHVAGDYVLREVASRIKRGLRENDVAARYGGEEFAILLPSTEPLVAWQIADRIRESIAQHRFEVDDKPLVVTLSGGVGTTRVGIDKTGQASFVDRVDSQLYKAKHSGKNCVKLHPDSQDLIQDLATMDTLLTQLQEKLVPSRFTLEPMSQEMPIKASLFGPQSKAKDRLSTQEQRLLWQIIDHLSHIASKPQAVHRLLNATFRDCDTLNSHNVRTAFYAIALGTHMGLPVSDIRQVGLAALLHDFGKIHVPPAILNKPGALTLDEFALIKRHPENGYAILKDEQWLPWHVKKAVLCHHERLDGSGYPQQLRGTALTRNDRILAVCDIFDAMTSQRPYKKPLGPDRALHLMATEEVGRIDPKIFKAFSHMIKEDQ